MSAHLIEVMEKLYKVHRSLYEISMKKTEIIKNGDMDSLNSIMKDEQAHIAAIKKLEETRQTETKQICRDKENPTVSDCLTILSGKEQEILKSITVQLSLLLAELKEQNHLNQQMIHQSLQFVNFSLNILRPQPVSINYAPPTKQNQTNEISQGLFNSKA